MKCDLICRCFIASGACSFCKDASTILFFVGGGLFMFHFWPHLLCKEDLPNYLLRDPPFMLGLKKSSIFMCLVISTLFRNVLNFILCGGLGENALKQKQNKHNPNALKLPLS